MAIYKISFSDPGGAQAASGSVFSPTDSQVTESAARLLRHSDRFDAVRVEDAGRLVIALNRDEVGAP